MEKYEYRSYIKIRTLLGQTPTTIHEDLVTVFGDQAPTYRTVASRSTSAQEGKMDVEDKLDPVALSQRPPLRTLQQFEALSTRTRTQPMTI